MITGLDHVSLVVADIEAMTAFYRDVCGLAVRDGREVHNAFAAHVLGFEDAHVRVVQFGAANDTTRLELIQYFAPVGGDGHGPKNALGAGHVCFNVDDLEAAYRPLREAGVRFVAAPTSEITASGRTHTACYAQDPEGNWLEFMALSG